MSRSASSVLVFGVYMLGEGALLLLAPGVLLDVLGLGAPADFWPRAAGIAVIVLGLYYVLAARIELVPFFRLTVIGRTLQLFLFAGCVAAGFVSPRILLPAGVEAAAGLWTALALRAERGP